MNSFSKRDVNQYNNETSPGNFRKNKVLNQLNVTQEGEYFDIDEALNQNN